MFECNNFITTKSLHKNDLNHTRSSLIQWKKNIYKHQKNVIENLCHPIEQKSLFRFEDNVDQITINPFLLTSFSINL